MEYMKNTFKMCKETKCDTILCKAKEPKGGRPTTRPNQGQAYGEKGPNTNQMISKWRKTLQAWPTHP
jgi:hypothetical protein